MPQDTISISNSSGKKAVNGRGFEFDDLPKMGWKKLKGWMGFGGSKKEGGQGKGWGVNNPFQ